jgi:hypothetical protein
VDGVAGGRCSVARVCSARCPRQGRLALSNGARISALRLSSCPLQYPQVNKPNNYYDFETYVDDTATWSALSSAAKAALGIQQGAFSWPEVSGGGNKSSPVPPPRVVASPPQVTFQPPAANRCAKCNLPAAQGGCKCDANCDCIGELASNCVHLHDSTMQCAHTAWPYQ